MQTPSSELGTHRSDDLYIGCN